MRERIEKKASKIDRYIGHQVNMQRREKVVNAELACRAMDISQHQLHRRESGSERFPVSDVFSLKKELGMNIDMLFSHDGDYYSDIVLDNTEMADVFHYFSNIEDGQTRRKLLEMMKKASSVF